MKRETTTVWSSFPAAHKKRFYQGLAGYGLICAAVAGWLAFHSESTIKDWQSNIPSASAVIKNVSAEVQSATAIKTETRNISTTPKTTPPPVPKSKIYVSVIVSNLGLSFLSTEKTLNDMPSDIVLAFSPYAENLQTWLKKAKNLNHETLLQLPMDTAAYPKDDPGPRALSSRFSDKDNNDNLTWLLDQGKGTIGMINFMGSRFMTDKKRLSPIFDTLRKNESMFIETPGIKKSIGAAIAEQNYLPYLATDLQIDVSATDKEIQQQLANLEKIARKQGNAIGIAEPYPVTINAIKSWSDGLEKRGITLAPLSVVWENKPKHDGAPQPPQEQLRK
ncbi:MAG: divergent polysaccharide deacetylase family protein, partial [Alphaproteobacteria bacterium]|nr:divergent polysaccharide deacetylase family protein [Alphaproteobacteria bacterium]